jgi:DNA-binding CsgD family transcriptional regulator
MPPESTIREQIRNLEASSGHEEKLYKTLEIYMELFPVLNANLLRYSPLGFLAEGIISLSSSGLVHIGEIRDDIRSFPIIYQALRERKAKYISGIEYFKQKNNKYIVPSTINSLLVVPICTSSAVIGYICSSQFKEETVFNNRALSSLTLFGQMAGKILDNSHTSEDTLQLSKRELEVMKKISWGASTKELADSMKISEFTVKQYVKSAIQKVGAHNRTQAVAELLRKGIIN